MVTPGSGPDCPSALAPTLDLHLGLSLSLNLSLTLGLNLGLNRRYALGDFS
jgi:hypothetical protein